MKNKVVELCCVKNKNEIIKYIKDKKVLLDSGEAGAISLKNVYPSLLEEVFGDLENFDLNGWQCDYWCSNDEYEVFGTMYYGTATVTKKRGLSSSLFLLSVDIVNTYVLIFS